MLILPHSIGSITLQHKMGTGGVSESYSGVDRAAEGGSPRRVVVRRVLPFVRQDGARLASLEGRVRDLMGVRHPSLVPVLEWLAHGEDRYIVEEWVDGVDLERVIAACRRQKRPVPENVFLNLATQACNALEALHGRPGRGTGAEAVLHLGIRPAALLLTREGRVVVGGYALTRSPTALPSSGLRAPIPARMEYLSPEQTFQDRKLTPSSDMFSLAAVLYELITLQPLFRAESNLQTLHRVRAAEVSAPLQKVRAAMPGLDRVLHRALSADPQHRYQRSFVLREDLRALMANYSFSTIQDDMKAFLGPLFGGGAVPSGSVDQLADAEGELDAFEDIATRVDPSRVAAVVASPGPAATPPPPQVSAAAAAAAAAAVAGAGFAPPPPPPSRPASATWVDSGPLPRPRSSGRLETPPPRPSLPPGATVVPVDEDEEAPSAWSMPSPRSGAPRAESPPPPPYLAVDEAPVAAEHTDVFMETAPEISVVADRTLELNDLPPLPDSLHGDDDNPFADGAPTQVVVHPALAHQGVEPPPPIVAVPPPAAAAPPPPTVPGSGSLRIEAPPSDAATPPTRPAPPTRTSPAPTRTSPAPTRPAPADEAKVVARPKQDVALWPVALAALLLVGLVGLGGYLIFGRGGGEDAVQALAAAELAATTGGGQEPDPEPGGAAEAADPPPDEPGEPAEALPPDAGAKPAVQPQPVAVAEPRPREPSAASASRAAPEEDRYAAASPGRGAGTTPARASSSSRSAADDLFVDDPPPERPAKGASSGSSRSSNLDDLFVDDGAPASAASKTSTSGRSSLDDLFLAADDPPAAEGPEAGPAVAAADVGVVVTGTRDSELERFVASATRGRLTESDLTFLKNVRPDEPAYTRSRALLLMDAESRGDSRASKTYLDQLMVLPENRYNAVFLSKEARYQVNRGSYQVALDKAKEAERYWGRIPPELVFATKAEIYEVQAGAMQGLFYKSGTDLELLDQAVQAWRRYQQFAAAKGRADMVTAAEGQIAKLENARARLQ